MRPALVAALALVAGASASPASPLADPRGAFEDYKKAFGKVYSSEAEEGQRFDIFKAALERIEEGNKRNGKPVFGLTWMSDRALEESYKRGRKGYGDKRFVSTAPVYQAPDPADPAGALPAAIDWRLTRAVTPVKNQGQCGSCWAFSTAEEVESQYALHVSDDYSISLSPQQVNSCVESCDGCGGGDTVTAYEYLKGSPGLASSSFWPYAQGLTPLSECSDKACTQACSSHDLGELSKYEFYIGPSAHVTGFHYATPPCYGACAHQNLKSLASSVANDGPVSVCLNAGAWNDYTGGVLTAAGCGSMADPDVDHCVQLVGYNTTAPEPYWIVRNSWSASWGVDGYVYLQFDKNTCGLANEATVVELASQSTADEKAERLRRMREQAMGITAAKKHGEAELIV